MDAVNIVYTLTISFLWWRDILLVTLPTLGLLVHRGIRVLAIKKCILNKLKVPAEVQDPKIKFLKFSKFKDF